MSFKAIYLKAIDLDNAEPGRLCFIRNKNYLATRRDESFFKHLLNNLLKTP